MQTGEAGIWVYRKGKRPRIAHSVRAESAENHYFNNDPSGRSEVTIEAYLNETFEIGFHQLLDRLESPVIMPFDQEAKNACAKYIANMYLRSKAFRMASREKNGQFRKELLKQTADPLALRRFAAYISLRENRPIGLVDLARSIRNLAHGPGKHDEDTFFLLATTQFSSLPQALSEMHITLCDSAGPDFIQSDAAVAQISKSPLRGYETRYGEGIGRLGSRWILPISPRRCIRISRDFIAATTLKPIEVNQINEFMIRAAVSSVYSQKFELLVQQAVDSHIGELKFLEDLITIDPADFVRDYLNHVPLEDTF